MGKYKEVRKIVMTILCDQKWHTIEELQNKCEAEGLSFEGGRGPIYNVAYQLKKKGEIEANGRGEYRICEQNAENNKSIEVIQKYSDDNTKKLDKFINSIEVYLERYKKFNWISCTDEELQNARNNVVKLIKLAQKINNEFGNNV